MPWTDNYWDIVNDFYWVPSYLGLKSIPRKYWEIGEETVTVPKEMTNPSGPLYRRLLSTDDHWKFVRRQEEIFNHIFNLTLSILPGDVISELLGEFVGDARLHDYQLRGQAFRAEYPWMAGANVTTPDSFLLSQESVLAIEIKFNAKTSLDQLGKYVALIAGEEIYGGTHEHLNLLYIYPSNASTKFLQQTSVHPSDLGVEHFPLLESSARSSHVKALFSAHQDVIIDVLSRLRVTCITWKQLLGKLLSYMQNFGDSRGERSLFRLLDGLASEIRAHPLTGVADV
jgi:hypothetical protein